MTKNRPPGSGYSDKAGDVAVSRHHADGVYIHLHIYISSFMLIHKHTHKDNKENRGRKTIPLTTLSR